MNEHLLQHQLNEVEFFRRAAQLRQDVATMRAEMAEDRITLAELGVRFARLQAAVIEARVPVVTAEQQPKRPSVWKTERLEGGNFAQAMAVILARGEAYRAGWPARIPVQLLVHGDGELFVRGGLEWFPTRADMLAKDWDATGAVAK